MVFLHTACFILSSKAPFIINNMRKNCSFSYSVTLFFHIKYYLRSCYEPPFYSLYKRIKLFLKSIFNGIQTPQQTLLLRTECSLGENSKKWTLTWDSNCSLSTVKGEGTKCSILEGTLRCVLEFLKGETEQKGPYLLTSRFS